MREARERGEDVKFYDFKIITQYSSSFDELGRSITDKSQYFYIDEETGKVKDRPFDVMIRDPVYKLLKYNGSFQSMVTSKYFIDSEQKNEFFYKASIKVPFYLIYECSPNIQPELMAKYLENPFNPMMFVTYNQQVKDFLSLKPTDQQIQRQIHLNLAYKKFKHSAPNLLCFGSPSSRKSTLLNDIFGVQFEVCAPGSANLFHDSVDAIFSSKELPMGFNVFDFQGQFANTDFKLINDLLRYMPQTYILVQIADHEYVS